MKLRKLLQEKRLFILRKMHENVVPMEWKQKVVRNSIGEMEKKNEGKDLKMYNNLNLL